jgi:hypothetical protein
MRVVTVSPTHLDFGPARPGSMGRDISADPSLPPTAVSFNGGVRLTAPSATEVVATISAGTDHFRVRDVLALEEVLEPVDPGELPPGHHGRLPRVDVLEVVATPNRVAPLGVTPGQVVVVRVEYFALSTEGTFTGELRIGADDWDPIDVPLSLFLAEVATTVPTSPMIIPQGGSAQVTIGIHSLAGPDVDVSYEMSGLQLDTG